MPSFVFQDLGWTRRAALYHDGDALFPGVPLQQVIKRSANFRRGAGFRHEPITFLLVEVCRTRVKSKTETMMRTKWMLITFILIGMAALSSAPAFGQDDAPASAKNGAAAKARAAKESDAEWDVGGSFYEALTSGTSGNGTQQTPSNGMGGMLELRHIAKPLLGYELAFGFNTADQAYVPKVGACGLVCQNPAATISGNAAQVSLDYIVSHKFGNLRPFAVGGLGVYIAVPGPTPFGNNTSIRGAYIVGGGLDFDREHPNRLPTTRSIPEMS